MVVSLVRFCGGAGRFRKTVPPAGAGGELLEAVRRARAVPGSGGGPGVARTGPGPGPGPGPGLGPSTGAHACCELTDTVSPVMYEA
ncbi:hypothetical protein Sgleb_69810 [Streptomyces glebosus]|uniref:Uncharacterized protein n=1 Tax=Streptomyces glebosus TaxID=249580 RepID=A0A640T6Y1_9ACTN|nr:hypothetical protein Sgleb_69810 [Streptomyces glebosus]GHG48919.1 hypothetical protein GCM10010513_06210 [Streptomyces glebosus]